MSLKSKHLQRFMPYASDRLGLELRNVRCRADGQSFIELERVVQPLELPASWNEVSLDLEVHTRDGLLGEVLPPHEQIYPPVRVVLAVRCPLAFLARSYPATEATGRHECTLSLRRQDVYGDFTVTPYMVRTSSAPRRSGFAWQKSAWLAAGNPWFIRVDELKSHSGNYLDIVRKRFADDPEIPPRDRQNWFTLQVDGATPRLLLNSDHTELMRVLGDTSVKGSRAVARDVLFDVLEASVWPSLLTEAARVYDDEGEGGNTWHVNVLRYWARRIYADEDLEEAVKELADSARNRPQQLLSELSAALQRKDHTRHIKRLLAEVCS